MGGVVLVWLLQLGAAIVIAIARAGSSPRQPTDWEERLRQLYTSPLVINLCCGLFAFTVAGFVARANVDPAGITAADASFYLELAILLFLAWSILTGRRIGGASGPDMVFGSARFATLRDALDNGLIGKDGIRLGHWRYLSRDERDRFSGEAFSLHYTGERHLLTIAPTRAGKGVSTVVPNLLTFPGSAIIIDPKGENAKITYARRAATGRVYVLDPWQITGLPVSHFNPLDILTPDSPTLIDDALLIADALVVPDPGSQSQFWSDQARAFIAGFLLYLATDPNKAEHRHLGPLRDILSATPDEFAEIGLAMARSAHLPVRAAAARILAQNDEVRASILSTAQQNTHFLDSPALRENLSRSDFRFADLKGRNPATVYIVLPVDRIGTYSRWLRLLIALGIAQLARVPNEGARPVLFLLDEFAQLGRLQMVEDAYGLMAGMGIQLHAIVQDLSQLDRLYPGSWQTFLANAGAIQVFGTRDLHTAEYFSKMLGWTTATVMSYSETQGTSDGTSSTSGQMSTTRSSGTSSSSTSNRASTARPLLFPDELMRMDRDAQLLFIENNPPVLAEKIVWHREPEFKALAGNPAGELPEANRRHEAAPNQIQTTYPRLSQ